MSHGDDDLYADYADDFDEQLLGELGVDDGDDGDGGLDDGYAGAGGEQGDDGGFGPQRSPSPQLSPSADQDCDPKALMEARLSVIGSELSRALDSTMRPGTGAARSGDLSRSMAFGAAMSAAPAAVSGAAVAAVDSKPSGLVRPATSESGGMRQSQDLFAALDLANTNANLKQSYVAYWDAVEEQFRAEQAAEEAQRVRRTREAEKKHLQRLKARMAAREAAAAAASASSAAAKQEAGWDSGFVYDKPREEVSKTHATFDRPSVVKAQAALANHVAAASATGAQGATAAGTAPFASSLVGAAGTKAGSAPAARVGAAPTAAANAKAMPPPPSGVIDPARVRSVVQTHMPSYVLAKLARHRGTSAGGAMRAAMASTGAVRGVSAARSRKGSAAGSRPAISRRASNIAAGSGGAGASPVDGDEAALFSEEISPSNANAGIRSALSSAGGVAGRTAKPRAVSSAKPARPGAAALASTTGNPRAASAGTVKPTNASVLLAAERAAQMHAAQTPPDMKQIPVSQYNRLRKEVDDLRRRVAALEAENEQLRSGAAAAAAAAATAAGSPLPGSSPTPVSATSSTRPAPARANLSATAAIASRPAAASLAPAPTAVSTRPRIPGLNPLNLAALRTDENGNVVVAPASGSAASSAAPSAASTATSAAANALLSPRSRCAVSSCGQSRAAGKPYCVKHLAEQPQAAPSASPTAALSFAQSTDAPSSSRPTADATAASSARAMAAQAPAPAAAPAAAAAAGFGMHGLKLNLGGGVPAKYNYDYESDDNYGGTESEGSESEDESEGSMSMGASANLGGTARQQSQQQGQQQQQQQQQDEDDEHPSSTSYDDEEFTTHGGDTQRQMAPAGASASATGSGTARATARVAAEPTPRQYPVDSSQSFARPATGSGNAAPATNRARPDAAAIAPDCNALYSARPAHPRTSSTPRTGTTKPLSLESLRSSPYANLDAVGGSFEITQSGTFKRGGFSLNRQGMMAPSPEGGSGGDTERAGGQAFQWDPAASHRSISAGGYGPQSSQSHSRPSSLSLSSSSGGSVSGSSSSSPVPVSSPPASTPFFRPLNVHDIYTLGVLGRGSSGVVYRSFYAPSLELLAVKAISIVEKDKRKQLTQELRTLTLKPNAYTIGFRGAYFDEQHIYIALEYMDGGSLDDLLQAEGTISEIELAFIFEQVLQGLKHLQKEQIIHRDIKVRFGTPGEMGYILYNEKGQFKLTDFGIISDLKERSEQQQMAEAKTFVGTLLYMSPERIGGQSYSYPCDIWSMALSLLTCRVGHFAIPHNSHWELVNSIQAGPDILKSYSSDQVSDSLRDLLSHCLRTNPLERPTAAECLRHPFFANFRINGPSHPIPIPPHFPPPRTRPAVHPTGSPMESDSASSSARGSASGAPAGEHRSEKEERRARKAAEVEARNERHMLEQVCRLLVHRGMTSRPAASSSGTPATSPPSSAASPVPSPPRAVPIDPKLCERICDRLAALLKVSPAAVRPILTHTHNQFVGLA